MLRLDKKEKNIFSKFLKIKEEFYKKESLISEEEKIEKVNYPAKNVYVSFLFDLILYKLKDTTGFDMPFGFVYLHDAKIYYESPKIGGYEEYFIKRIETEGIKPVLMAEKKVDAYLKKLESFIEKNPVTPASKKRLKEQLNQLYTIYLEGRGHMRFIGAITPHIDARLKAQFSNSENLYQHTLCGLKSQTTIHEELVEGLVKWSKKEKIRLTDSEYAKNIAIVKFRKKLEECYQNGYFLQSGYGGVELWDLKKEYSLLILKSKELNLNNKKTLVINTLQKLSASQKTWVDVARKFSILRDNRKMFDQKSFYYIAQILEELQKNTNLSKSDYENLFISQILASNPTKKLADKQKKIGFCYVHKTGYFYKYGEDAEKLLQLVKDKVNNKEEILKGNIACAGKVNGHVKIIQNPRSGIEINSDEILVTGMTSPDFLPYMKQARGVITEKGGVTSHAALISREIQKPCITNVTLAISKLKDGDYIELDAYEGTIKKIEKIIPKNEIETRMNPESYKVSKSEDIIWFSQANKKMISQIGGKGANLGEMYGKFPVPNGFCVSVDAYKRFMNENKLFDKINSLLSQIDDHNNVSKLTNISGQIQSLIIKSPLNASLENNIRKAYKKLDSKCVAVRSSATAEDLPSHSFAGQLSSFLDIEGEREVFKNIKKVWASLFTSRVIYYRIINKFQHSEVFVSVIVQEMIQGARSGVLFTANPVSSNRQEVVIEATYGLGESVVSGIATPDYYRLDKINGLLIERKLAKKEFALLKRSNGVIKQVKLSKEKSASSVLLTPDLKKLVKIGKKIEEYYKSPQDIEWVLSNGRVYIVQSRSITTLKRLIFVTSNKGKIREAKKILGDLENINFDYDEIQELDAKKVIEAKLKSIKMPGRYFVEDTSLYLEGLNGLPGPFIKWFVDRVGCEGIYKLVKEGSKKAVAKTIIGYSDGVNIRYFEGEIKGEVILPRGKKGFGWDPIFRPEGYKKTFAEMTIFEKNKVSMRRIALEKLKKYLDEKN